MDSYSQANIEIFSSKKEAVAQFEKWERKQNNSKYSEPCSCGKHKANGNY